MKILLLMLMCGFCGSFGLQEHGDKIPMLNKIVRAAQVSHGDDRAQSLGAKKGLTITITRRPRLKLARGKVNVKGVKVYFQSARMINSMEPKLPILFLHGAAFSSQTWVDLKTIQFLARAGYYAVAVDLPGYGKTKGFFRGDTNDFMTELISDLDIGRPVLVSPSMSGRYSLPYILSNSANLRGYIPVAPSLYDGSKKEFAALDLPTLIIYGSQDTYGKKTSELLRNIPGSQLEVIPNGSHPAYRDDPALFHSLVKKFLDEIHKKEMKRSTGINK